MLEPNFEEADGLGTSQRLHTTTYDQNPSFLNEL